MSGLERESVRVTNREGIAYLTLAHPPLNILTISVMDELAGAVGQCNKDSSLKGIAVTAEGKAFSAGADVEEHKPEKVGEMIRSFGGMLRALDASELPIVMAVEGAALGGGFELAMMADILLASENATFGQPEIRLGFFAPLGVSWLQKKVGSAKAIEITATGRAYSASEMMECGLVSRVVKAEGLEDALESVLKDIRRASPLIMRMNVRMLKRTRDLSFDEGLSVAERAFLDDLMSTEDVLEGIAAFYEKRRPEWRNR